MADYRDPLNQRKAITLYCRGAGEWEEKPTLGIKILINGRQYGIVIGHDTLLKLGLAPFTLKGQVKQQNFELVDLVEGTPPPTIE